MNNLPQYTKQNTSRIQESVYTKFHTLVPGFAMKFLFAPSVYKYIKAKFMIMWIVGYFIGVIFLFRRTENSFNHNRSADIENDQAYFSC